MARPASTQPTDGELEILKQLWKLGPCELGQLLGAIRQQRAMAPTTLATMLKVMRQKGLVKRTPANRVRPPVTKPPWAKASDGKSAAGARRAGLWSAKVTREATASRVVRRLVDKLFEGSSQRLVAHLLSDTRISAKDRQQIRELLAGQQPSSEAEGAEPREP